MHDGKTCNDRRVSHITRHCNGYSGTRVEARRQLDCAGCILVDDSIEVWRPVVESAWHDHPGPHHYGFSLAQGGSLYLAQSGSSTSHQGVSLNLGGILYIT